MARRPLAALLVLGAGALTLTGCIILPPAIPVAPPLPTVEPQDPIDPVGPGESGDATEPPEPTEAGEPAGDLTPTAALGEPVTIDDGAGDAWTITVTQVEPDPPLENGAPEPGTRVVALVIDAQRVEGSYAFLELFEFLVVGSDGNLYDYASTVVSVTPERDVYYEEGDAFTGARVAVQLPEGVEPTLAVIRSSYGQDTGVPDTVIAVQ